MVRCAKVRLIFALGKVALARDLWKSRPPSQANVDLLGFASFRISLKHSPRDAANDRAHDQGCQKGVAAFDPQKVAAKV
jgi:hypothetical protein